MIAEIPPDEFAALVGASPEQVEQWRRQGLLDPQGLGRFDELDLVRWLGGAPPPDVDIRAWPLTIDAAETGYFKPEAGKLLVSPADETPVAPSDVQPEELDIAIAVDRLIERTTIRVTWSCVDRRGSRRPSDRRGTAGFARRRSSRRSP